jgi:hypothetical protein
VTTSLAPILTQLFDDYGEVLAGGFIYTYEAGTVTPLVTYTDLAGAVPNANPVELDASGRATVRVTDGVAYKFIVKDSDGATIETIDNIIVGESASTSDNVYLVHLTYCETPGAQAFLGGSSITHACTFPIDFDGASGSVQTNPSSEYIITVKKNGVECGTISIATTGVFTFETTGGATVSCVYGDDITFHAPDSGTAADILATLVGELA